MKNGRFNEKYFLTDDQIMLRESVQEFAQQELAPRARELDAWDHTDYPFDLMYRAGELGYLGLSIPEEYGGTGMDSICEMIMIEEIARVSSGMASAIDAHSGLALAAFVEGGSEEQKKNWLAPAARGEKIAAFALTEPGSGSDSGAMTTSAKLEGDEWVINGTKHWITNFNGCDFFVVAARTDPESKGAKGVSVFYVDAKNPGVSIGEPEHKTGNRGPGSGTVFFTNCRIPKDCLIGEEGEGFKIMMKGLDEGRLVIAALSIGIAQDSYDRAVRYANEREQFGKPIGKQQIIGAYLADMASQIDLARTMLYHVCRMKDAGLEYTAEAAAIKVFASEMCVRVTEKAVQIHGGNGYSEEYIVERNWRDSKLQTIGEGTSEILRCMVLARRCLNEEY